MLTRVQVSGAGTGWRGDREGQDRLSAKR